MASYRFVTTEVPNVVPTLTAAVRQIREDIATVLSPDSLRCLGAQVGHTWRERILDPVTTIPLFVLQILHRNTAAAHRPRRTGRTFSPSAYCPARARLPLPSSANGSPASPTPSVP